MEDVKMLIKEARERKGLSQTELAERLGVTKATVSGYETGASSPTVSTLQKIAKALDIPLKIILG